MSAFHDREFVSLMKANGYEHDTTTLMYNGVPIDVSTAAGDSFRNDMIEHAAREMGMEDFLEFSGEFTDDMSLATRDRITEVLMARAWNPSAPVRLGARLALTGVGIIATSQIGKKGYWPTLVDGKINVFGDLVAVGVAEYPYLDPDILREEGVAPDSQAEPCVGVVALMRSLEVRGADRGELLPKGLMQAVVPLPIDELQFHRIDRIEPSA
jgi:hypothetical protein